MLINLLYYYLYYFDGIILMFNLKNLNLNLFNHINLFLLINNLGIV